MTLEIIDSGPPLSGEEIRELEATLEVRLPTDYVDFLYTHNGGEFALDVDYPLLEPPPRGTGGFRYFRTITRNSDGELWLVQPPDVDMQHLYNIGLDEAGSICLACSGPEYGKVYFVDSDRGLEHWFCLIANSFTEFLSSFRPSSE